MTSQQEPNELEVANYVDRGQYRGQQQLPTDNHPNLRNHEIFSYAKTRMCCKHLKDSMDREMQRHHH